MIFGTGMKSRCPSERLPLSSVPSQWPYEARASQEWRDKESHRVEVKDEGGGGSARMAARISASYEEGKLTRRLTKGTNAPDRRHKATHSKSRVARPPPPGVGGQLRGRREVLFSLQYTQ